MKCVVCHGVDIEVRSVNEELSVERDVVYVPIKTLVCGNCGERYYDRRTVRFLERVERELGEGTRKLREIGKVLLYD